MKQALSIAVLCATGVAGAQPHIDMQSTMNLPDYSVTDKDQSLFPYFPRAETPRLRQRKLKAAIALRAEAAALLAQDGGTFTRRNETYIRRKARDILSWRD